MIEEILKVKSESIWISLENVLKSKSEKVTDEKFSIYDFSGILSNNEAKGMKAVIAEACETINEDDWK